jgi:GNAT superfamily N-acetyltransferase
VSVEPARTGDAGTILELMEPFYLGERYPFDRALAREALLPLLEDPRVGRAFLVREGGIAVGYVVLTFGWSLEYHGRDAFVDEIYVAPAHRGRGLASRALDRVEEACRELGVHALHLEVERENRTARALYQKRGFSDNDRLLLTRRFPPSEPSGGPGG